MASIFGGLLNSTIVISLSLLVVALGGMFTERSGVINIGLDGCMIIGALAGTLTMWAMNKSGLGEKLGQWALVIAILVSVASGILYSMLLAFASIHLKADQTIGGTALNMFAPAFGYLLVRSLIQGSEGQPSSTVPTNYSWATIDFGFSDAFRKTFIFNAFFKGFTIFVPLAILIFIIAFIVLYKTRFGLRLMSCGEHPQSSASAGINVYKMRYIGVSISGALSGFGGAMWSLTNAAGFQPLNGVAGFGFLALAVMIFGNWKPQTILGAAFIFGFFNCLGTSASSISWLPSFGDINGYVYKILPYFITLVVLAFSSKNSKAPKAEGIPYDVGMR